MKPPFTVRVLTPLLLIGTAAIAGAAEPGAPADRTEPKTDRGERPRIMRHAMPVPEKETVTFLGVETSPVTEALTVQLGLPRSTGLVVRGVVAESPAASVLREHDILLRLDDQMLIETRQLAVLVRNRKSGDEVTLTIVRGGKESAVRVKLTTQEVPKFGDAERPMVFPFHEFATHPVVGGEPAEVDRLLSLLEHGEHKDERVRRLHLQTGPGPRAHGLRAQRVSPANSNLVFSDEAGVLELTIKDGAKTLVAKDPKGVTVFSGPINTPDERERLPAEVRERLERVEGMDDVVFHTDGDLEGDFRVLVPGARKISVPLPAPRPAHRAAGAL